MGEMSDAVSAARFELEAVMSRVRVALASVELPVAAAVFAVTIDVEGALLNVCVSHPTDDVGAAIELAISTAAVMSEALG
jgi:uncharacterized membrane protein YGL010W